MAFIRQMQQRGYKIEKIENRHQYFGVWIKNMSNKFIVEIDSLSEFSDEELEKYYN